jgi:hypothetical protein
MLVVRTHTAVAEACEGGGQVKQQGAECSRPQVRAAQAGLRAGFGKPLQHVIMMMCLQAGMHATILTPSMLQHLHCCQLNAQRARWCANWCAWLLKTMVHGKHVAHTCILQACIYHSV